MTTRDKGMRNDGWIIEMSGLELGPLPLDELESMIHAGEVQLGDRVRRADSDRWLRAETILTENTDVAATAALNREPASRAASGSPESPGLQAHCSPDVPAKSDAPESGVVFAAASVSHTPAGIGLEQTGPKSSSRTEAERAAGSVEEADIQNDPPAAASQFVVLIDDEEVGPLPWETVVEMGQSGRLEPGSAIRLEHESEWQSAETLGFRIPPPERKQRDHANETGDSETESPCISPMRRLIAAAVSIAMFPFDLTLAVLRSIARWTIPVQVASVGVSAGLVFAATQFLNSWDQTACTARVTLDGDPLPGVVVTLTGMSTGEMGVGVSDGNGSLDVINREGQLSEGEYHVTINEPLNPDGSASSSAPRFPSRYNNLSTTDLALNVVPSQDHYAIELTTEVVQRIYDNER